MIELKCDKCLDSNSPDIPWSKETGYMDIGFWIERMFEGDNSWGFDDMDILCPRCIK